MTDPFAPGVREQLAADTAEDMLERFRKADEALEADLKVRYPHFWRVGSKLRHGYTQFESDSEDLTEDDINDIEYENMPMHDANSYTSEVAESLGDDVVRHIVAIDLDMDAALIPSTTPGHFHLLIDKELTWEAYSELLRALQKAGIIEEGYLGASLAREHTRLRTPWTTKVIEEED